MKIGIIYYTKTNHTLQAAQAIKDGINSTKINIADFISCQNFDLATLNEYDVLVFGSPCWIGGKLTPSDGIATPLKKFLNLLPTNALLNKTCAGFSIHGGNGAEKTIKNIGILAQRKGCPKYIQGPFAKAGAPLSLWAGPDITNHDLEKFFNFGISLTKLNSNKA